LKPVVIFCGILLLNVVLWVTRGMILPPTEVLSLGGIILLAGWVGWAFFSVFRPGTGRAPARWIFFSMLLLVFSALLLLIRTNLMYDGLTQTNPELLFRGPIQITPKTIGSFLVVALWAYLFMSLLGIYLVRTNAKSSDLLFGCLLGLAFSLHLLVLRIVPFPFIDVFTAISEAVVALAEGKNPYSISYTDIYQGKGLTPSGFGYLPGYLPIGIIGMLLGDIRMGNLVILLGCVWFLWKFLQERPFRDRCILGSLFLMGGGSLFVTEQAWIDGALCLGILASLWCIHKGKLTTAALWAGWFCATKQYGAIGFIFLLGLILRKDGVKNACQFGALSFLVGILWQIPFLLWDREKYLAAAYFGIGELPFRPDAFTLLSVCHRLGLPFGWLPWVGGLMVLVLWLQFLREKGSARISRVLFFISLAYLVTFLSNRHAFCNYFQLAYWLLVATWSTLIFDDDSKSPAMC